MTAHQSISYNPVLHELGSWHSAMGISHFPVGASLSPYFQSHTLLTGVEAVAGKSNWYILPDNSAYLIFYLEERSSKTRASLRLIGPRSRYITIDRRGRHLTFVTAFRPGGTVPFADVPTQALLDHSFDAFEVFPGLEENLLEALTLAAKQQRYEQLPALVEASFSTQVGASGRKLHPLVPAFLEKAEAGPVKLRELARELGVSERYLRELVKESIGHHPKLAMKIKRFSRSLLLSNSETDWQDIAYLSGYYDQSHMIGDYREMIQVSPHRLFGK